MDRSELSAAGLRAVADAPAHPTAPDSVRQVADRVRAVADALDHLTAPDSVRQVADRVRDYAE